MTDSPAGVARLQRAAENAHAVGEPWPSFWSRHLADARAMSGYCPAILDGLRRHLLEICLTGTPSGEAPIPIRGHAPVITTDIIVRLRQSAIAAHEAGTTWADWWPTAGPDLHRAIIDRDDWRAERLRLLQLVLSGDLDGHEPIETGEAA